MIISNSRSSHHSLLLKIIFLGIRFQTSTWSNQLVYPSAWWLSPDILADESGWPIIQPDSKSPKMLPKSVFNGLHTRDPGSHRLRCWGRFPWSPFRRVGEIYPKTILRERLKNPSIFGWLRYGSLLAFPFTNMVNLCTKSICHEKGEGPDLWQWTFSMGMPAVMDMRNLSHFWIWFVMDSPGLVSPSMLQSTPLNYHSFFPNLKSTILVGSTKFCNPICN